jgi:hypothetical protein
MNFFSVSSTKWYGDRCSMNWKGFGRRQSWPNQGTNWHSPSEAEENHENLSQDNHVPAAVCIIHFTINAVDLYLNANVLRRETSNHYLYLHHFTNLD